MRSMLLTDKELPVIKLFGDQEECFYQLGLKDSETAKNASHHIKNLISTPWDPVNIVAHKAIETLFDKILLKDREYEKLLKAYASGTGIEFKELSHAMLVPEVCAFLGQWLPKLSTLQFGCSSVFTLNNEGKPTHTRILDFPLKGTYDKNERIISSKFKEGYQVFNFSTVGLPFSGLTSMNDQGLTLAVHQKFTNKFNQHGTPVFYLAHQLIHNCKNVDEALEFLKSSQTITCWNFNFMDKSGRVIEADLSGTDLHYREYNLHEDGPLYVCNELVNQDIDQEAELPYSIKEYNELRKEQALKKLQKVEGKDNLSILKEVSTPQRTKKFSISPITVSSMASVLFDVEKSEVSYIPGEAPKIYTDSIATVSNIWESPTHKIKKSRPNKFNENYFQGMKHFISAQRHFDLNELHECYHSLQMAIDSFEPESLKAVAQFYFTVVQYIHEPHSTALKQIQKDLLNVYPKLPRYLKDVALIIDQRIEILTSGHKLLKGKVSSKKLSQRYEKEAGFNKLAQIPLRHLTFIHLDIMEVIFA